MFSDTTVLSTNSTEMLTSNATFKTAVSIVDETNLKEVSNSYNQINYKNILKMHMAEIIYNGLFYIYVNDRNYISLNLELTIEETPCKLG